MSSGNNTKTQQESAGIIRAIISDFQYGVRTYENVELVRIKSSTYSLLIMEDYFPSIGSIHGVVDIVLADEVVHLPHVDGFYLHRNNEFSLLIETGSEAEGDTDTDMEILRRDSEGENDGKTAG